MPERQRKEGQSRATKDRGQIGHELPAHSSQSGLSSDPHPSNLDSSSVGKADLDVPVRRVARWRRGIGDLPWIEVQFFGGGLTFFLLIALTISWCQILSRELEVKGIVLGGEDWHVLEAHASIVDIDADYQRVGAESAAAWKSGSSTKP